MNNSSLIIKPGMRSNNSLRNSWTMDTDSDTNVEGWGAPQLDMTEKRRQNKDLGSCCPYLFIKKIFLENFSN